MHNQTQNTEINKDENTQTRDMIAIVLLSVVPFIMLVGIVGYQYYLTHS